MAPNLTTDYYLFQWDSPLAGGATQKGPKNRSVEITFTKWVTTYPLMEGNVGGDVIGKFAGEIFERTVSANGSIIRLEPMYQVIDMSGRDHSFTALIRGGTDNKTGAALLEGVILAGWRRGARVEVEFQTKTNCTGAPTSGTCFEGTIRILPDKD